jgi:hypothetical protein
MIFGAILLLFGLIYLVSQEKTLNRLIDIVNTSVVEREDIYQQSSDIDVDLIRSDVLYAILMGYREYPILIDGTRIEVDGSDYEYYFSLIRKGYYSKSYQLDIDYNILQVNYVYTERVS